MPTRIKIIIIIFIIIASLAVAVALFKDVKDSGDSSQPSSVQVLDDVSSKEKESALKFVKNFLSLYNSYSFEDYSNLEALGDYETQNAQKQTLERIERLRKETPLGFLRNVEVNDSDIEIKKLFVPAGQIQVKAKFLVVETIQPSAEVSPRSDDSLKQKQFEATARLKLVPYGKSWLVDDIVVFSD
ncbi:MAG: hypothetical protein HYZ51_04435 [Candidatus Doudnabacteria bacterium]|nr:hypothetical protein [Candidatus Doudnabacteria bacterium]